MGRETPIKANNVAALIGATLGGWVSFRARVINLFFRFRRKMNPKKALTGSR